MQSFENKIQSAISAGKIPGAVTVASKKSGSFSYSKAHGPHSLKDDASEPLKTDGIFWIASCTKLLTAICVLQCVERLQFTLDEDVARLLPELKDLEIVQGFDPETGAPKLVKATKFITLRHLLTHTSGLAYDHVTPELIQWRASRGETCSLTAGTLVHRYNTPLMFEPGEAFQYSTGLDWAGKMIERANNMTLEQYMQRYIMTPLILEDLTFHIEKHPSLLSRYVGMTSRKGGETPFGNPANPTGAVVHSEDVVWTQDQIDDCGGIGAYISMPSYQKIVQSITISDGKLLNPASNNELFKGQLSDTQLAIVHAAFQIDDMRAIMAPGLPKETRADYALGGMIVTEDVEGRRRKGTMYWGGFPNLAWWADREAGVSGVYGSQLVPTGDKQTGGMFEEFEKAVYAEVESA
ncbi:hypothetical protein SBOR_0796 [Sclerotinia borealis F-4128]|uniref:Beta-lactamase-related domain-containing protein n=1 Tax=Sclerotinia borealis (strain F-4128) TaxID=1432307 RepID=W9CPX0_SCLBF|nr:hypothetical protein SBOR_0796 [Sclerotinia borealis F-4128]